MLKKIVSEKPAHVGQWPLSKNVVATVCPLHFDTKSEQSDCNKSSVRQKFRTFAFNKVVYSGMSQVDGKCIYSIQFQSFCNLPTKTY